MDHQHNKGYPLPGSNSFTGKRSFEHIAMDSPAFQQGSSSSPDQDELDNRSKRPRSASSADLTINSNSISSISPPSSSSSSSSSIADFHTPLPPESSALQHDQEQIFSQAPFSLPQFHAHAHPPIPPPAPAQSTDQFQASLERFNEFDQNISALRRSPPPTQSIPPSHSLCPSSTHPLAPPHPWPSLPNLDSSFPPRPSIVDTLASTSPRSWPSPAQATPAESVAPQREPHWPFSSASHTYHTNPRPSSSSSSHTSRTRTNTLPPREIYPLPESSAPLQRLPSYNRSETLPTRVPLSSFAQLQPPRLRPLSNNGLPSSPSRDRASFNSPDDPWPTPVYPPRSTVLPSPSTLTIPSPTLSPSPSSAGPSATSTPYDHWRSPSQLPRTPADDAMVRSFLERRTDSSATPSIYRSPHATPYEPRIHDTPEAGSNHLPRFYPRNENEGEDILWEDAVDNSRAPDLSRHPLESRRSSQAAMGLSDPNPVSSSNIHPNPSGLADINNNNHVGSHSNYGQPSSSSSLHPPTTTMSSGQNDSRQMPLRRPTLVEYGERPRAFEAEQDSRGRRRERANSTSTSSGGVIVGASLGARPRIVRNRYGSDPSAGDRDVHTHTHTHTGGGPYAMSPLSTHSHSSMQHTSLFAPPSAVANVLIPRTSSRQSNASSVTVTMTPAPGPMAVATTTTATTAPGASLDEILQDMHELRRVVSGHDRALRRSDVLRDEDFVEVEVGDPDSPWDELVEDIVSDVPGNQERSGDVTSPALVTATSASALAGMNSGPLVGSASSSTAPNNVNQGPGSGLGSVPPLNLGVRRPVLRNRYWEPESESSNVGAGQSMGRDNSNGVGVRGRRYWSASTGVDDDGSSSSGSSSSTASTTASTALTSVLPPTRTVHLNLNLTSNSNPNPTPNRARGHVHAYNGSGSGSAMQVQMARRAFVPTRYGGTGNPSTQRRTTMPGSWDVAPTAVSMGGTERRNPLDSITHLSRFPTRVGGEDGSAAGDDATAPGEEEEEGDGDGDMDMDMDGGHVEIDVDIDDDARAEAGEDGTRPLLYHLTGYPQIPSPWAQSRLEGSDGEQQMTGTGAVPATPTTTTAATPTTADPEPWMVGSPAERIAAIEREMLNREPLGAPLSRSAVPGNNPPMTSMNPGPLSVSMSGSVFGSRARAHAAATATTTNASNRYSDMNLSQYHQGPFRASLARTAELNRRRADQAAGRSGTSGATGTATTTTTATLTSMTTTSRAALRRHVELMNEAGRRVPDRPQISTHRHHHHVHRHLPQHHNHSRGAVGSGVGGTSSSSGMTGGGSPDVEDERMWMRFLEARGHEEISATRTALGRPLPPPPPSLSPLSSYNLLPPGMSTPPPPTNPFSTTELPPWDDSTDRADEHEGEQMYLQALPSGRQQMDAIRQRMRSRSLDRVSSDRSEMQQQQLRRDRERERLHEAVRASRRLSGATATATANANTNTSTSTNAASNSTANANTNAGSTPRWPPLRVAYGDGGREARERRDMMGRYRHQMEAAAHEMPHRYWGDLTDDPMGSLRPPVSEPMGFDDLFTTLRSGSGIGSGAAGSGGGSGVGVGDAAGDGGTERRPRRRLGRATSPVRAAQGGDAAAARDRRMESAFLGRRHLEVAARSDDASMRAIARDMRRSALLSRRHLFIGRRMGDYVRDEDFDTSYEGLLQLTSILGEVRPRNTPQNVIDSLPSGTYGEWAKPGESDARCPICLDDYKQADPVLKLPDCSHWFHKECLQQWLKAANTCPVCRGRVGGSPRFAVRRSRAPPQPSSLLQTRLQMQMATQTQPQPEAGPSRPANTRAQTQTQTQQQQQQQQQQRRSPSEDEDDDDDDDDDDENDNGEDDIHDFAFGTDGFWG